MTTKSIMSRCSMTKYASSILPHYGKEQAKGICFPGTSCVSFCGFSFLVLRLLPAWVQPWNKLNRAQLCRGRTSVLKLAWRIYPETMVDPLQGRAKSPSQPSTYIYTPSPPTEIQDHSHAGRSFECKYSTSIFLCLGAIFLNPLARFLEVLPLSWLIFLPLKKQQP